MNQHLSDRELAQLLAGNGDPRPHVHVAGCDDCRAEAGRLRAAMAGFRSDVQRAGEHDEFFWARQRHRILAATERHPVRHLRWAVGFVVAVAAISAVLLVTPVRRAPPVVPVASDRVNDRADEQLLLEVQSDLSQTVPEALAPAEVLQQERATVLAQLEKKEERKKNR